jgi:hypothetical protein
MAKRAKNEAVPPKKQEKRGGASFFGSLTFLKLGLLFSTFYVATECVLCLSKTGTRGPKKTR